MKLCEVNYLTESCGNDYSKKLRSCSSLLALIEFLPDDFDGLVLDALEIVSKWKVKDFEDFKQCLKLESKGIFTGEDNARRFSAVMMPALMFKAEILADQFKVPWGLAIRRLVEYDPDFDKEKALYT